MIFAFLILMGILNIAWILVLKSKINKSNLNTLYICNSVKFLMISVMTRQGTKIGLLLTMNNYILVLK